MSEDDNWEIILRRYPKVIFMYPICLASLILWIVQWALLNNGAAEPNATLASVWMWVFFANIFIMEFEINSGKFFLILVGVILVVLALFIWGIPAMPEINIKLYPEFYAFMFAILGFCILIGILEAQFDYWKFEKNELMHKKGILTAIKRYPTQNLRYTKEINDVFEFLILRAGRMILYLDGTEPEVIPTVLNITKKAKKMDKLLSQFRVKMVN